MSEHQDYEAALAEAERSLMTISQQLTSHGALPEDASSLADNQQQLAKHQVKYNVALNPSLPNQILEFPSLYALFCHHILHNILHHQPK